jgi:hypothetical protein
MPNPGQFEIRHGIEWEKVQEGSLAVGAICREPSLSNSLFNKEMARWLSGTPGHRGSSEYLGRTGLGFR